MNTKTLLTVFAGLAITAGSAHAASIQVDVGSVQGAYSGINAPAHNQGDLGAGDTFWNALDADASSGLVFSDGSAATGVSVDFGVASGTGNINWGTALAGFTGNGNASGFLDTELMQDWGFTNSGNNLGVRVSGLAPGEYTVYSLHKEHTASSRTYDIGIGVDTDDTTAIADLTVSTIAGGNPTSWAEGTNYVTQSVTVNNTSDWIVIISDNTNNNFASINGFQIYAVPEPGSLALLGLGGLCLIKRRRRD